ncbi:MAG: glycosyltransferase family 4 protein [Candidatus Paceibacterota bacterium]
MTSITGKSRHRIGIDARMYRKATGGLGRYTRELLHHLLPLDTENDYIVFLTEADLAEWDMDYPHVRLVVTEVPHFSPIKEQTTFLKELYAEKLDLMHFLNFNHPVLYNRPFVVTLHDLTMFLFPVHGNKKIHPLKKIGFNVVFRRAMKSAKKIVAISEYTAFDAEKQLGVSHAKMEVVYEGGPEPLQFLPGSKDMAQKYLGTRDPYFLFVSQWRPHKGILTIIEAFNQFKQQTGLPHKLVLVGNPEAATDEVRDSLVKASAASDIIAPGFAPEEVLPALFHYSTCFIMPSEYEGFGLPVLEAFAYGAPVIAADNSSLPEVTGQGGLLFPTRDAHALCEQMKRLALEPRLREELVRRGDEQLQKFSWERCAKQTRSVYQAVLEKRR